MGYSLAPKVRHRAKETQRDRGAHRTKAQKPSIPHTRLLWDTRLCRRQGTGAKNPKRPEALTEKRHRNKVSHIRAFCGILACATGKAQGHRNTKEQKRSQNKGTEAKYSTYAPFVGYSLAPKARHRGKETQRCGGAHITKAQKQSIPHTRLLWDTRLRRRQGTGAEKLKGTQALTG